MTTRTIGTFCLTLLLAGLPVVAHAYVGPGAGLSLAAAFWAILVAIGTILVFTLMWPVRRMMRRRSAAKGAMPAADPTMTHGRHDDGMTHGRGAHGS